MKKIIYFLLLLSILLPINTYASTKTEEQKTMKEEIKNSKKAGLYISLAGALSILSIVIIYKKKKIKL